MQFNALGRKMGKMRQFFLEDGWYIATTLSQQIGLHFI